MRSGRKYVLESHGQEALAAVQDHMGPHGRTLEWASESGWYAEDACAAMLRAFRDVVAKGDAESYLHTVVECAHVGVRNYVRAILSMTGPSFVLRRSPALWELIRRGPTIFNVAQDDERTVLDIRRFPYFAENTYPILIQGLVGALVQVSGGYFPPMQVLEQSDEHLLLEVRV